MQVRASIAGLLLAANLIPLMMPLSAAACHSHKRKVSYHCSKVKSYRTSYMPVRTIYRTTYVRQPVYVSDMPGTVVTKRTLVRNVELTPTTTITETVPSTIVTTPIIVRTEPLVTESVVTAPIVTRTVVAPKVITEVPEVTTVSPASVIVVDRHHHRRHLRTATIAPVIWY